MRFRVIVLALSVLAMPTVAAGQRAASQLEVLRSAARTARDQLSAVRAQQLKERTRLSELSAQIETLKGRAKGRLLPGGELDDALKKSQELSEALTDLARRGAASEAEVESANTALIEGLKEELARVRARFDADSDRSVRKGLVETMKQLKAEREALRAALPKTSVAAAQLSASEADPETLLEQADLLRDNEEKVRVALKAVEVRIAERRDEVELDRQMQRFLGEESMFDDQDRRLRAQSSGAKSLGATAEADSTSAPAPSPAGAPGRGSEFGQNDPANPEVSPPTSFNGQPRANEVIVRGFDARLQVGQANPLLLGVEEGDLAQLETERTRLEALAKELESKALELEHRAAQP